MSYGIKELQGVIYCANCENFINGKGELRQNYCEHCGSPLTEVAINATIARDKALKIEVIPELQEISKDLNTDSFRTIAIEYLKDEDK